MVRRIIVLSDGTGNSAAGIWRTNVWRLYQALDLSNGRQVALYDDGVGSSAFKPLAVLGGAFGWGLKRNVLDLYRFVCRNWTEGAEIYGFGFSRGAFTIRVLVGLIATEGLVPVTSERQLHRDAVAAYRSYRRRYTTALGPLVAALRGLRDALLAGWSHVLGRPRYRREHNRLVPRIKFLGLWDTVAAYGLPIEEMTRGVSLWLWPLSLPDRKLSPKVERARHALALDDERTTFFPVLWTERGEKPAAHVRDERISQVWFAGVHSNVGGGYPDDSLAHVSLHWMMQEARACGLEFKADERSIEDVRLASDVDGRLYDSRYGLAAYYRYCPRKLVDLTRDSFSRRPDDEVIVDVPEIHESVFQRIRAGGRGYTPLGLPASYTVVTGDGRKLPADGNPYETREEAAARFRLQEWVWNLVWWRRLAYFVSVTASAYLALFPWIHPSRAPADRASPWSFLSGPIRAAGAVLPAVAQEWVEAFAANPGWFALWTLVVAALMVTGRRLEYRIRDRMRALWQTRPTPGAWPDNWLYRLRTHPRYRQSIRVAKRQVLPTLFAGLIVVAAFAGLSRGAFVVTSSLGLVCRPSRATELGAGPVVMESFRADALCWASGVRLQAGRRYRITIEPLVPWDGRAIYFGLPFRRRLTEPWFRPIARIGSRGNDEYVLPGLVSQLRARTSGELFLFVNDGVIELPGLRRLFYRNNAGTARVTVEQLGRGLR